MPKGIHAPHGTATKYDAFRTYMRDLGTNQQTQKARITLERILRRLAEDLGTETMALVDCATRGVPLDQALALADVTRKESDQLLAQVSENLNPIKTAMG